jgi:hypothetical protein
MQIYFPLPDGDLSANVIDKHRLKALRSRGRRVLESLLGINDYCNEWPAANQWRGYEWWLGVYIGKVCRVYAQLINSRSNARENQIAELLCNRCVDTGLPPWMGDPEYHRAHRSKLMFLGRKDRLYRAIKNHLGNIGSDRCVHGWLSDNNWSPLAKMTVTEVVGVEGLLNTWGGVRWTSNFYSRYDWDVNDRNEIPWPDLTTA